MVHYEKCPLCESNNLVPYIICKDHLLSGEDFNLNICNDCHFVLTQDHPDESDIGRYYESDEYISHSDTGKGFSNKIYRLVRTIMLRRKEGIIKNVSGLKKGNLLDIGSGTGHFVHTMKKAGWNVTGIEINEKAREFAISRFGKDFISPEKIVALSDNSFDCVTLWHVLEHFQKPYKYFEEISRILKPEGTIIIALPNNISYDADYYRQFWAAYDVPRHLWHFSPSTFMLFAKKFSFEFSGFFNLPFDVFFISIMSEKYKGSKLPFISGLLNGIRFKAKSVFSNEKDSSVIYILRKSPDQ
jgi:SAM-dependent methyltransferase